MNEVPVPAWFQEDQWRKALQFQAGSHVSRIKTLFPVKIANFPRDALDFFERRAIQKGRDHP